MWMVWTGGQLGVHGSRGQCTGLESGARSQSQVRQETKLRVSFESETKEVSLRVGAGIRQETGTKAKSQPRNQGDRIQELE